VIALSLLLAFVATSTYLAGPAHRRRLIAREQARLRTRIEAGIRARAQ